MGTTKYYCGDYLLSLHNKDNEYQYINNNDLQVEYVEQGIIYPIEFSHTNTEEDNQYGGVCNKDNVFVELSKNTRIHRDFHNPYKNWYIGANPNVKVDDIEELKQLKNMLLLYYDLGFNPKKYYKLQKQGKLKERLAKKYSENEIKLVEQYLEEKGPTLVKKLTN